MSAFMNILLGGVFHAAVLFLVAAGLQLVFGVQKILNLACGSFYALGAYFGITFIAYMTKYGMPPWLLLPALVLSGLLIGLVGPFIELLLTFAILLMFQDVFRFLWGANPLQVNVDYLVYGKLTASDFSVPVYNLMVIAAAILIAAGLGLFLQKTNYGRVLRATAENRTMAEALGVDVRSIYAVVFTVGTMLGTVAGALVIPTAAAALEIPGEFIVEAFAVVVIGGLGSMPGALAGALVVGLIHAFSIVIYPELELLVTYLIVIGVLLFRPAGLFGKPAT